MNVTPQNFTKMNTQKIYITNLKASEKFGNAVIKGAICLEEFMSILEQDNVKSLVYEFEGLNYINIQIVEKKAPNKYGKTHYMEIDNFVPKGKKQAKAEAS